MKIKIIKKGYTNRIIKFNVKESKELAKKLYNIGLSFDHINFQKNDTYEFFNEEWVTLLENFEQELIERKNKKYNNLIDKLLK